jgi:hypothetical protein
MKSEFEGFTEKSKDVFDVRAPLFLQLVIFATHD